MSTNDVSVVVINYNNPYGLQECVNSLLDQTVRADRIIVVDDGSTPPLIDCVDLSDPSIVYTFHDNQGRAFSRNRGGKLSTSNCTVFVDGDCIANDRLIENHLNALHCGHRVVLGTNMVTPCNEHSDFHQIRSSFHLPDTRMLMLQHLNIPFDQLYTKWTQFWSNNFSIVTCDYQYHLMDESFNGWGVEDIEFGYRLLVSNIEFTLIDNPVFSLPRDDNDQVKRLQSTINYQRMCEKHHLDLDVLDYAFLHNTHDDGAIMDLTQEWDMYMVYEQRCIKRSMW